MNQQMITTGPDSRATAPGASPPSANEILRRAASLAPTIAARAGDIESSRRLPPDVLAMLRDAGCFRIGLPRSHGGAGASLPEVMTLFETLARADASTAWSTAIGCSCWLDVAGLPRATFDLTYDNPDRIIAGVFRPSGTARRVREGYRIDGQWALASGCVYADWIYGNTIESDGTVESMRTVLFRPDEIEIEDTWHAMGMRGTASHHFRVMDVIVPAERTFPTFASEHCVDVPMVRLPVPSAIALMIASIALGTARGAIDDILGLATDRQPLFAAGALVADSSFQHELAQADTELRAARHLAWRCADDLWDHAEADEAPDLPMIARTRATAAWAARTAVTVAETAYRNGGASAIYEDSPLQRRLRDLLVMTQHFLVRPDVLTTAGAVFAGQPVTQPVF